MIFTNHSAASNLVLLKRLLKLLKHSKVTDVNTDTLTCRSERAKGVGDVNIDLSRICLAGDNEGRVETGLLSNKLVQLFHLVVVTVEDLEERGLSTSGTLDTTEAQVITRPLQVAQIHQQVLNPQRCTLANRHELCGLSVGETQAGQVFVFLGESGQLVNHNGELGNEDVETITKEDKVGVIGTVARSSTPVNDTGGGGGDLTVGVDVGHDIVSPALLLLSGNFELLILNGEVSLHLLNCLVGDGETEFCDCLAWDPDEGQIQQGEKAVPF